MAELVSVDGRFAIQETGVDDFGCERTLTRVTPARVAGSIIDASELPMEAEYNAGQRKWLAYRPDWPDRPIWIEEVPDEGTIEAISLADADVDADVIVHRVRELERELARAGRRLVPFYWHGPRKPSKKAISMFTRWAEHVLAGGDPDAEEIWEPLYEQDRKASFATTNLVYNMVIPLGTERRGAGGPHVVNPGDVAALFGKIEQVPLVLVGDVPDIDWCAQ